MRQHLIARHVIDHRHGLSLTRPLTDGPSAGTSFLAPDAPTCGRTSPDGTWSSPSPSRASRTISDKGNGRGSCRGSIVDRSTNRVVQYESVLERDLAYVLLADRRVVEVREQADPVGFVDRDGSHRHHCFDFIVRTVAGLRIAYAVKYSSQVESSGVRRTVDLIRRQTGDTVADRFVICTEKHLQRALVARARWILRARSGRNEADVAALAAVVAALRGSVTVNDLAARSGLPSARARNAIVNLVDEGVLALADGAAFDDWAVLRPAQHPAQHPVGAFRSPSRGSCQSSSPEPRTQENDHDHAARP